MNSHTIILIKLFIVSLGLVTYGNFSPMMRINSSASEIMIGPTLWPHLFMFLAYVAVPIIVLLINNYISYTMLAGMFLLRTIIELIGMFPSPFSLHMLIASLYIIATLLSLILAAENLSSKIRGEIFRLKWSQF